ncbi:hypothetical protein ACHAWC_010045 [Mediolabrus comicus]
MKLHRLVSSTTAVLLAAFSGTAAASSQLRGFNLATDTDFEDQLALYDSQDYEYEAEPYDEEEKFDYSYLSGDNKMDPYGEDFDSSSEDVEMEPYDEDFYVKRANKRRPQGGYKRRPQGGYKRRPQRGYKMRPAGPTSQAKPSSSNSSPAKVIYHNGGKGNYGGGDPCRGKSWFCCYVANGQVFNNC